MNKMDLSETLTFINIKTNKKYVIEGGWYKVRELGGLNKILPKEDWNNIYEKNCLLTKLIVLWFKSRK